MRNTYNTSKRALELEREIRATELRLDARIAAAEARADEASARADRAIELLTSLVTRRAPQPARRAGANRG